MSQQTAYANQPAAFAGNVVGDPEGQRTYYNDLGTNREVIDVAIDTVTNSATYTFTINGYTITYTADGSATAIEIRDGLIAAARAVAGLESLATFNPSPTGGATAPVRVTAKRPDIDLTYADSDAKISASTITAFAAGVVIPFGRAVIRNDVIAGDRSARLPTTPTAQVATVTPTAANSTVYVLAIRMRDTGEVFNFDVTSDADGTATEIATLFRTKINASGVPVTGSGTATLILTSDNPGREFDVVTDDANLAVVATTASASGTFLGVCRRIHSLVTPNNASDQSATGGAGEGVAVGEVINVVNKGEIWVECEEALAIGDQLFWRHTASGANTALGRFRNDADTNTCLPIPRSRAVVRKASTGPGLALIELL
jgi:hypothetical protein